AGAETHDNGEPAKADRSERPDAEPAHPDVPDRHPNPESPGATDDADPAADDRESAAADAGEPRPDTEAPDIADGAETGDPAPQERPDAGALTETDREGADQPAERTPDRADEQEATPPEGEAARDPYREGNDTERAGEHEKPESTSEPEEGANETPDGPDGGNDDHGSNAEGQPESPESEEDKPVIYRIRMPDGREFGPPDTDLWVFHRGRLDPVNENQDLSEPDPEKRNKSSRLFRALLQNPDDAQKTANEIGDDLQKAAPENPPRGNPNTTHDTRVNADPHQHQAAQVGDIMYAIAATALFALFVKQKISSSGARGERGANDDYG